MRYTCLTLTPDHPRPPFSRRGHAAFVARHAVGKPFVLSAYAHHIERDA